MAAMGVELHSDLVASPEPTWLPLHGMKQV